MSDVLIQPDVPTAPGSPDAPAPSGGVTLRAVVIALVLTLISALWVRQSEILVISTQVTESVPPVPALTVLAILVGLNPLLARFGPRFRLSRSEQIAIYCFVAIAISICGPGVVRYLLTFLTAPFFFAAPGNGLSAVRHLIPSWLAVHDLSVVHGYYAGVPGGAVPWGAWAVPLLSWGGFLLAMWVSLLCLCLLVRHRWSEGEHLAFPLVVLPLEITDTGGRVGDGPAFFRNPLMWGGFGLACAYNIVNILHVLSPAVPAPGTLFDLSPMLSAAPWNSLAPIQINFRPELVGFGFLVPTEISFSICFFYLLGRAETLVMTAQDWNVPGRPFEQEQSMGAFIVLGVFLLWQVREDLVRPLRVWLRRDHSPPDPSLASPWAVVGLVVSFAFLCGFCMRAGLAAWAALAYLGVLVLTALVYARIRADAGVPLIWLFPYYQQKKVLFNLLGMAPFASATPQTLTIFAILTFLSRGYFPALIGYQVESLKMADEARIPRRQMVGLILGAGLVGIAVAFALHLSVYYQHGAQYVGGGLWGLDVPLTEFGAAQAAPLPPDPSRTWATVAGGVVTIVLVLVRQWATGFPLHPIGYAAATAYGSLLWWPFLVVWAVKASLLRWGGIKSYRRAVPFFLGLALGHLFLAGVVWGLMGAFWPDAAQAYGVWFG